MMTRAQRTFILACSVLCLIGLLGATRVWLRERPRVVAAESWQRTTCTVSDVQVVDLATADFGYRIVYEYWGPGQISRFQSSQIDLFSDITWSSDYEDAMKERRELPCWYDPKNPSDAVLQRGYGSLWETVGLWGLLVFFPGCLMAMFLVLPRLADRHGRRPPAPSA